MYAQKIDAFEKCVGDYFAAYFTAWEISSIENQLDFAYKNPDDKPNFLDYTPEQVVNRVLARPVAYNLPYPYVDTNPIGHIGDYSRRKYTYFDAFYLARSIEKPALTVVDKEALIGVDIISFPEVSTKRKHTDFLKLTYHESVFPELPDNAVFEPGEPTYIDLEQHESGKWLKMNVVRIKVPIMGNPAIFHSIHKSNAWGYNIRLSSQLRESYTDLSTVNDLINDGGCFMKNSIPMYVVMFLPIFTNPGDISDVELDKIKSIVSNKIEEINALLMRYKPYYDNVKAITTARLLDIVSTAYTKAESSKNGEQLRQEREKNILKRLNNW